MPASELTVANGIITHAPTGRKTSYGKVAAAAAKVTPPDPKSLTLRDPREWKVAGKPMKRLDTAQKLNGSLVYAIDVKLPGMLCAAIKDCPVYGGKLVSFDNAAIAKMPGVEARGAGQRHDGRASLPTPGGTPRRRSTRCRSCGTKARMRRAPARRSTST